MARSIDFNALEQPTIEVVMRDDAKTKITVIAPSEALIEKLSANIDIIKNACKSDNPQSMDECYSLTAEFMSCNKEGLTITGEELRKKYNVNYVMLFVFLKNYMDFIDDIKNAKN